MNYPAISNFYLTLYIAILVFLSPLGAAWESIGPAGGNLRAMARARSDEAVVYAASFTNPSQVVRSTNGGTSWTKMGAVPDYIYCLAVDPSNEGIVYAGCSSRVYRSANGGADWIGHAVSGYKIFSLAIHPSQPSTIRAAGAIKAGAYYYMACFSSTNGGTDWTSRQLVTDRKSCGQCVAIDPNDPQTIYIGGSIMDSLKNPYVFKSTDGGASFTGVSAGLTACSTACAVMVHPANSGIVYFSTDAGIFRSADSGANWAGVSAYRHIYSLAVSPADPDLVLAGADTTIYKSTDAGMSWFAADAGLNGQEFRSTAISRLAPADAFAGSNTGFFKTTDGGSSWSPSNTGMNICAIDNFAVSRQSPPTVYMEISGVGEFKTADQGANWEMLPDFLSCGMICGFAIHNADPDTVYALEGAG